MSGITGPLGATPIRAFEPTPSAPRTPVQGFAWADAGSVRTGAPSALAAGAPAEVRLPTEVALGAYTLHRYQEPRPGSAAKELTITVFGPIPDAQVPGRVYNFNKKPWNEPFPQRFVIGDGGRTRAMIGIDQRPGTPLDRHLRRILARIPTENGVITPEAAIQFVTKHTNDFIAWAEGGAFGDGRATLPWDRNVRLPESIFDAFDEAMADLPGRGWRTAGAACPVVPLERWIDLGLGYCIQKSILAALVLDRVGVPVRVVNGAVDQGPGQTGGHTWVELLDGRAIDPGWSTIVPKLYNCPDFKDRFWLSESFRFEFANYPYLVLD